MAEHTRQQYHDKDTARWLLVVDTRDADYVRFEASGDDAADEALTDLHRADVRRLVGQLQGWLTSTERAEPPR